MKRILFLLTFLGCTFLLYAQSATDEADMQTFARQFMAAYNSGDHTAIGKMYTDDAVRIDQEGKEIRGAANITAFFAEQFRLNNATLLLKQSGLKWSNSLHAYMANGSYEVYGITNVYDIKVHFSGAYANTMLKQNGKWKITKSVLSPLTHPDPKVAANIDMYSDVWHRIVNEGRPDLINAEHFTEDVRMHTEPENIIGIEAMAAYYKNFLAGFSGIQFTINNVFGEGDQLVKHWTFKGRHTGDFFGIPATGNLVKLEGSTIARMSSDGRIAEERDFMDNMALLSQLGIVSSPGNVAVVDGLYKSFAKGDISNALATMDPNIIWNEAEGFPYADRNPYIGPQAVLEGVFARIGEEWEYWNLTDIKMHEMSNNQVLSTLRYKAKYKKNGEEIDAHVAHWFTLKDGKIIRFQQFTDTGQVIRAMKQ
jgi:uncharacterized protein